MFQKGQSGNPKGRPKGSLTLAGLLRKKSELTEAFYHYVENSWEELLANLFTEAKKGNLKAIFFILEHVLYNPPESVSEGIPMDLEEMTSIQIRQRLGEIQEDRKRLAEEKAKQSIH